MDMDCSKPLPPSPPHSPPVPPRSPLRPPPRRPQPLHMSIVTNIEASSGNDSKAQESAASADSPIPLSASLLKQQQEPIPSPVSAQTRASKSALTKRQHALHELLSSERAYASDLALIKDVHIPLALGQPAAFHIPASATKTSNNARTLSTASSSTTSSFASATSVGTTSTSATSAASVASSSSMPSAPSLDGPPPMTPADARMIFSNIADLAVFSDHFCDLLQDALGSEIEGGYGEDCVGEAFLAVIPDLETPYKHYITKHSSALAHLTSMTVSLPPVPPPPISDSQSTLTPSTSKDTSSTLSTSTNGTASPTPTPAQTSLANYLSLTRAIASTHTHAWDLPSLLIKPVQRLLKYPLLLQAIIDSTPESHPDYIHLKEAKSRMEEVARSVNEGRRRKEVVREVLEHAKARGGPFSLGIGGGKGAGKNLSTNMSIESLGLGAMGFASVGGIGMGVVGGAGKKKSSLGKMKSLKGKSNSSLPSTDDASHPLDTAPFVESPTASAPNLASTSSTPPSSSTPRPSISSATTVSTNPEAIAVAELAAQLDHTYAFLHGFARDAVAWTRAVKRSVEHLELWSRAFARVIGLRVEGDAPGGGNSSADSGLSGGSGSGSGVMVSMPGEDGVGPAGHGDDATGPGGPNAEFEGEEGALQSEAFDAFLNVVRIHLLPLSAALEPQLRTRVLAPAASLVRSMDEPKTIVNAMNSARPLHEHLLHTPISSSSITSSSKSRPSAQLLHASSTYLALRGQLYTELPAYVALLQRGVSAVLAEWAALQEDYFRESKLRWAELWEMLRVEGEGNTGGAGESVAVWETRWREVFEVVNSMAITRPIVKDKTSKDKDKKRSRNGSISGLPGVSGIVSGLESSARSMTSSRDVPSPSFSPGVSGVTSMLASLDPALPHTGRQPNTNGYGSGYGPTSWHGAPSSQGLPYVSGPLPLAPRPRTRGLSASEVVTLRSAHRDSLHYADNYHVEMESRWLSERERERELGYSAGQSAQSKRSSSRSRRTAGTSISSGERSLGAAGSGGSAAELDYALGFGIGDPGYEEYSEFLARDLRERERLYREAGGHSGFGHEPEYGEFEGDWRVYDDFAQMMMLDGEYRERGATMPGDFDPVSDYVTGGLASSFSQSQTVSTPKAHPRTKSMPALGSSPGSSDMPFSSQNAGSSRSSREEGRGREKEKEREKVKDVEKEKDKDRGRTSRKPSLRRKLTDSIRPTPSGSGTQVQATQSRHRSPSARSINRDNNYFAVDPDAPPTPPANSHFSASITSSTGHSNSYPSWTSAPAKYMCQVVHACHPPPGVSYFSYPFFTLVEGDVYEVLHEAGHPSMHPKLPLHIDDGADCLLLVRDANAVIGWALASFLIPLDDI
ncbi:hypothetical protein HGRIS_001854 [Hohenbuehelia grisea]|uniref:DH domain-containing protein n=1 Tax=Hohenbuehelia grisea TaxID=104357 RepID=A0ABR3JIS4_9AGAR